MKRIWFLVLAGFLTGCFGSGEKADSAAGLNKVEKPTDSLTSEMNGMKWQRIATRIGDGDYVRYGMVAKNGHDEKGLPRLLLGCGKYPGLVIEVPSSVDGNVRLAFDGAAFTRQKWTWMPQDNFLTPPGDYPGAKRVFAQMARSKTLTLEFTPRDRGPQLAIFEMLDIRDLVRQEPACRSWR